MKKTHANEAAYMLYAVCCGIHIVETRTQCVTRHSQSIDAHTHSA